MSLLDFIKLFGRHLNLMVIVAVATAALVFYLTKGEKSLYSSSTVINTGIVSGYTIERSKNGGRIDREYANNEISNLITMAKAYETIQELATQLLTEYVMLENYDDPSYIAWENRGRLREVLPDSLKALLVFDTVRAHVYENVIKWRDAGGADNPVYDLIYSKDDFFGLQHLQGISVNRKGNSDLIEMSYTTSDPAVCRRTLMMLTDIFIKKYKRLKEGQSEDVLGFFEEATSKSEAKLRAAENRLLEFRVDNKIINYYEQTRFIAGKKEDLDELLFNEKMNLEGTKAALTKVEKQLDNRGNLTKLNASIIKKREELSEVTGKIARHEILAFEREKVDSNKLIFWKTRLEQLKGEIENLAVETYALNYTPEGVGSDQILSEWLKAVIALEQTSSRLAVIEQRKKEFNEIYSQFAPWGSRLKRIEREIGLAENAYLENLHSYNQARLHLVNTLMSANLQVLDAPFYPTSDLGSKRMLLVVVGFLAGFAMTFGIVILMEFLDTTLKKPVYASEIIGLPLYSAFPKFPIKKSNRSKIDYDYIRERAADIAVQNMLINLEANSHPPIILFTSTREQEGVTFLSNILVKDLRQRNHKVLYLFPFTRTKSGRIINWNVPSNRDNYTIDPEHLQTTDFQAPDWISKLTEANLQSADFDFIAIELPSILSGTYPTALLPKTSLTVLLCRANRSWNTADQSALASYQHKHKGPVGLIINGVKAESLEDIMGEVPKRRSFIRKLIKRIVLFQFSEKSKL